MGSKTVVNIYYLIALVELSHSLTKIVCFKSFYFYEAQSQFSGVCRLKD